MNINADQFITRQKEKKGHCRRARVVFIVVCERRVFVDAAKELTGNNSAGVSEECRTVWVPAWKVSASVVVVVGKCR